MVAAGAALIEPRLSPDATAVAYLVRRGSEAQLVVRRLGPGPGIAIGPELVLTTDPGVAAGHPDGGGSFCWTSDGRTIVFVARDGRLFRIAASGGPASLVVGPHAAGAGLWSPTCSPDGSWVAYIEEDDDTAVLAMAPLDPSVGWPVRLTAPDEADFTIDPHWGPDGALAWHRWSVPDMPWDGGQIVSAPIDLSTRSRGPSTVIDSLGAVGQPRWSPDGSLLALVSDAGGWRNVVVVDRNGSVVARFDEQFEHADPTWGPGQASFAWSPDGRSIAFERNEQGFGRLCIADVSAGSADAGEPVRELGRGVHRALSWGITPDGHERIVAVRQGARTPTQLVVYEPDAPADAATRTVLAVGPVAGWDELDLPEPEVVTWKAGDGAEIPGRLYRPKAGDGGPPPLLVSIHGGPTGQTRVAWNARYAYFLSRGWAILVPDHRGTTGWGRAFQQAMLGRWGDLDIHDTAAGVRHAMAAGWCDPDRVVAMGGSAGGFTVLGLLGRHPELFAAGVDLYGVTDLIDLDATTHRFERHYQRRLVGERPATESTYLERSPVSYAADITAPLLVLHGTANRSVPIAQSEALVAVLEGLGRPVELHRYEGEGHGWSRADIVVDELTRIGAFLDRHVTGR